MKFAKSILTGTGAVVLAGLILALLVPKAAHAVAATLVQVANTPASPVPNKDIDQPGRHAFVQQCTATTYHCTLAPSVPDGMVFVIQTLNSSALYLAVNYDTTKWFFSTNSALAQYYVSNTQETSSEGGNMSYRNNSLAAVNIYEDSGANYLDECILTSTIPLNLSCIASGYLISVP
jgi:hypothetical protein